MSSRLFVLLLAAALVGTAAGPAIPAGAASAPPVKVVSSSGCRSATAVPRGETQATVTSGGVTYSYYRYVPRASSGTTPLPVVVDFHGYSEGAATHRTMSALEPFGETNGFITITPQAVGPVARWQEQLDSADLVFFGDLLDQVESTLCVDTNRVFVSGLSNGAFMTSAVACKYATRVAAVATVAGIRNIKGCKPKRPVPVVAFHGTKDPFVAFGGGYGPMVASLPNPDGSGKTLGESTDTAAAIAAAKGPSVPKITSAWAERNDCATRPSRRKIGDDVTLVRYRCPKNATVELYRVADGGHAWPGSEFSKAIAPIVGRTTFTISADEIMWKFFEKHPLTTS